MVVYLHWPFPSILAWILAIILADPTYSCVSYFVMGMMLLVVRCAPRTPAQR